MVEDIVQYFSQFDWHIFLAKFIFVNLAKECLREVRDKKSYSKEIVCKAISETKKTLPVPIDLDFIFNDDFINLIILMIDVSYKVFDDKSLLINFLMSKGFDDRSLPFDGKKIIDTFISKLANEFKAWNPPNKLYIFNALNPYNKRYDRRLTNMQGLKISLETIGNISIEDSWYEIIRDAEELLNLAIKSQDTDNMSNALDKMGECYINLGQYDNALECLQKALDIDGVNNFSRNNIILYRIAWIMYYQNDYDTAELLFRKTLRDSKLLGDVSTEQGSAHFLSRILFERGQFIEAIKGFEAAQSIRKQLRNYEPEVGHDLRWISRCYYGLNDIKTYRYFLDAGLEKFKGKYAEPHILLDEGKHYLKHDKVNNAIDKFIQSKSTWEYLGYRKGLCDINIYLGHCYEILQNYKESIKYYSLALDYNEFLRSTKNLQTIHNAFSKIEESMGIYAFAKLQKDIEAEAIKEVSK